MRSFWHPPEMPDLRWRALPQHVEFKATIFLPKTAPKAKMIQALQYGAHVVSVDGNYDMAFDLSLEYSKKY